MIRIQFNKYQGAGNDFIIIDAIKQNTPSLSQMTIEKLCNRKFGVGADGLICVEAHKELNFTMRYYNSDGKLGSFCGNGARCAVAFAKRHGYIDQVANFQAYDGRHRAKVSADGRIELHMADNNTLRLVDDHYEVDTGSPHYVTFVEDVSDLDIVSAGKAIRYSSKFYDDGINVNFVEIMNGDLFVATYERGVENETLSCGTGVTASALAYFEQSPTKTEHYVLIHTKGGQFEVKALGGGSRFTDIWLIGPADFVFEGMVAVSV